MKQRKKIKDWRSTGRKRGRAVLYLEMIPFKCRICDRTSIKPPPDAPDWFDEIWPEEKRELEYSLQVNHISKDYTDNDPANLEWLCGLCHKFEDMQTGAGVIDTSGWGYPTII